MLPEENKALTDIFRHFLSLSRTDHLRIHLPLALRCGAVGIELDGRGSASGRAEGPDVLLRAGQDDGHVGAEVSHLREPLHLHVLQADAAEDGS